MGVKIFVQPSNHLILTNFPLRYISYLFVFSIPNTFSMLLCSLLLLSWFFFPDGVYVLSHAIPTKFYLHSLYSYYYKFPYLAPPNNSSDPISIVGYLCFILISRIFLIGFILTICLKFQDAKASR